MQISLQNSGGKVVYLRGSLEPPLAPTGVKVLWSLKEPTPTLWDFVLKLLRFWYHKNCDNQNDEATMQ